MEIKWIDPSKQTPPFDEQILVVLGGSGSTNAASTWQSYVKVQNVIISKRSPNDDDPCSEYAEFFAGEQDDYDQFQFYVFDFADYTYGMGEDEDSDWYSDAILCWAKMPALSQFHPRKFVK